MKIILIAAATLFCAIPAFADADRQAVRYDDLDLASVAGQDEFAVRVDGAISDICRQAQSPAPTPRKCFRDMREDVLESLPEAPRAALAAAYERRAR